MRNLRLPIAIALTSGALLAAASSASAASQVWWINGADGSYSTPGLTAAIARSGIDGSSPTTVISKSATGFPTGVAVDLWSGKMFYVRGFTYEIVSANLDGSNPQVILSGNDVAPTGGSGGEAWDLAYDHGTDSLYWIAGDVTTGNSEIRRAKADGSSPTVLYSQAQLGTDRTFDLTIVPQTNRIYWGGYDGAPIKSAKLDGSGDFQNITPNCGGTNVSRGVATAIDPTANRMWVVAAGDGAFRVRKVALDGSACETLVTVWTSFNDEPLALDKSAGRLLVGSYDLSSGPEGLWAIDPTTPGPAPASAAVPNALPTTQDPGSAIIVEPPKPIGASASLTASDTTPGSTLTLAAVQDTFAPDEPGIKVYRGVTTKSTAWYRDGVLLPGETGSTLTATEPGVYKAVISASNIAGSVETTSNEVTIAVKPDPGPTPGPTPSNAFKAVAAAGPSGTVATVARVPGAGKVRQVVTRVAGGKRVAVCSTPSKTATGPGRVRLACKVNSATRSAQKKGAVRLRVRVTYTPTGGTPRTLTRYVTLRSLTPNYTG